MPTPDPEKATRPSALVGKEGTQEGAKDLSRQPCIPGASVSQRIRKREHPLTDRHMRQHAIDEPGRCVRHSQAAAGRAEPSALARKGDEPIVTAGVAMDAQKSMREDPALEIGADLSLDKASNRRALSSRASQEGLELFANDFVEKSLLGLMALISNGGKESVGTLRARALPGTASDMPGSP
jgi:hypothetical protein